MMTKKIISIIFAIILVLGISTTAFAYGERFVFDDAGILTYDEIEDLSARAEDIAARYGCEVYIITYEGLGGYEAWELNELLYDELCELYGAEDDVVILLLAMEERQYDIMAHGYGNNAFTDYGKDVMAERFLDDFANDDWYWGFIDYLDTCDEFLEMAAEGEPFDVGSDSFGSDFLGVIIIIAVSCLIALVVCLILRAQMKTAVRQTEAGNYITKNLVLTKKSDRFLHRDIIRRYNPPQENNGGGGGTTVNSGGSSHKSGGF